MTTYTIDKIRAEMIAAGSHWWDVENMEFFDTTVHNRVYQGTGGIYFVTGESLEDGSLAYFVRRYLRKRRDVVTVSTTHVLSNDAHRKAIELAGDPEQAETMQPTNKITREFMFEFISVLDYACIPYVTTPLTHEGAVPGQTIKIVYLSPELSPGTGKTVYVKATYHMIGADATTETLEYYDTDFESPIGE